jgi:hypothetical protein
LSSAEARESTVASRRELLLVAGGLLSILYLYSTYWHGPRDRELAAIRTQVSEAKVKLDSDLALLESLSRTGSPAPNEEPADLRLDQVRGLNSKFANLLNEVSSNEGSDPFKIIRIATGPREAFAEYLKVLFKLEFQAPFHSVGRFLERLEKSDLLTEVVSVDISRADPELKRCTVRLELYSYASRQ